MVLNLYVNIVAIAKVIVNSLSLNLPFSMVYALVVIGVLVVCFPLLWILMVRLYKQVVEFEGDFSFWKYIWVIPALIYMIFFVKIVGDYWKAHVPTNGVDITFTVLWAVTTYTFSGDPPDADSDLQGNNGCTADKAYFISAADAGGPVSADD